MARAKKAFTASDELLTVSMDQLQPEQCAQDAGVLPRNKSDTNIAQLGASKNHSNLYIIKSYSFIDRSHAQRSLQQKAAYLEALSLQRKSAQVSTEAAAKKTDKKPNKKQKSDSKGKQKKAHQMQKSKSADDSCDNLCGLLREPAVILEHVESEGGAAAAAKRPQSVPMPIRTLNSNSANSQADSAAPTKTAAFRRESFIRQSLQSIRRSFGAHKKNAGKGPGISSAFGTSTTSTTSLSSGASLSASSNASKTAHNNKSGKWRRNPENGAGNAATPAADFGRGGRVDSDATLTGDALEASVGGRAPPCGDSFHPAESVSTLAATQIDTSMAPLQSHVEAHSVTALNLCDRDRDSQAEDKQHYQRQHSANGSRHSGNYSTANSTRNSESSQHWTGTSSNTDEPRSLKHSSSSLNPLVPGVSLPSIRSISPSSRKSASSSNSSNTAKHEQSTAAATAAAAASTEKEKKRKEVSSSRVKKFHRHFAQVSKDEKLINYFSCALVSDILLQGHLYITDQHFAFYSNVFGYVTKVVIPTSSVTKISKEKTAKIIPNAVGVATADERHVFGSFISREAAFRLMCSVCPPLAPAEILPKAPADIEISEEYSIEDDSSCSISGNESPPQALAAGVTATDDPNQTLLKRNVTSSSFNIAGSSKTDIPANAKQAAAISAFAHHPNAGVRASAPPAARYANSSSTSLASKLPPNNGLPISAALLVTPTTGVAATSATNLTMIIAGTASSTTSASSSPTPSTSSSPPTTVMAPPKSAAQAAADSFRALSRNAFLRLKFPTELHVVYLGVLLTMVLALFSVFLLYRILDIEAKTSIYRSPADFNWRNGNDDDIFAEALRWQKELQTKSTEEAQSILTTNLEQIAKVRRSLETLSMLIHDRSSAYANRDDSD